MDPQLLDDRLAIIDLTTRYALGVDLRDWPLYRACFDDRFEIDAPGWPETMAADEWVAIIRAGIERYAATHHQMSNHSIEVDGDRADCIAYVRASHHQPQIEGESPWILVGYYRLALVRREDAWKIARFNLTILWNEGNLELMAIGPQPPAR